MSLFRQHPDAVSLKDYQRRVLDELGDYVRRVSEFRGISASLGDPAELAYTVQTHQPWQGLTGNSGTPFVCVKVPTGGGKTLIAAHAAGLIYNEILQDKDERGIVLWLTPSDTIRSQTLRALKDLGHPYRRVLQEGFNGPVHVMDNVEALRIRPDQVRDGLTVIVSTMQAMKRDNKESLKFYSDNGYLESHFSPEDEREEVTFSLFEVIRRSKPLIIADEGHNAKTVLALDLIESLDPSFVLELTATPHDKSNVLVRVTALELKEEQMVKLPINVTNVSGWEEALAMAVEKRGELEEASSQEREATGEYIRPMLLIQAEQEQENPDKVHVARIKDFLVREMGVPEPQIKIKTGKQDQLGDIDLLAEDVEVRYVITRDALKEGWDAPFAYVLASVFSLGSPKAIEQLLGRILRLPNVREKRIQDLNEGYVYTSAEQFGKVLKNIVNGMEENGYGRDEVRVMNGRPEPKYMQIITAKEEGLTIPLMAVNADEGIRELRYRQDLLGDDFNIAELDARIEQLNRADPEAGRLDLREDQSFGWEMSEASEYSGAAVVTEGSEDLVRWLLKKIGRYEELADKDLLAYVKLVVEGLVGRYGLEDLYRAKYQIRDQIKQKLDSHYEAWTGARYEYLKKDGTLTAYDSVAYSVPPEIPLPTSQCTTSYQKSVFKHPGKLNDEEADLANKLDRLDNLVCWYRNPDKDGFALQGYWKARFNPDFIAFTKTGKTAVLEYKGENLVTNEDTKYKDKLGQDWAALDTEGRYFKLVTKANMQSVLKEVADL